jgi:glucan biosynthesis protein C
MLPYEVQHQVSVATTSGSRIHHLDNLRAIAMMLGVFLHAGFAYAEPANVVWLATDIYSSSLVDGSIWFIHLFRMGLFFLLSGYFSKMLIEKRGALGLLKNRALRIALPFVIFYPVLFVAMTAVIIFAISYLEHPNGVMGLIAAGSQAAQDVASDKPSKSMFSLMHLWFLYYLFWFSLIGAAVGKRLESLLVGSWRKMFFNQLSVAKTQWMLFSLMPLTLIPSVMLSGVPMPAPESFVPSPWPFLFYGAFYFSGWMLRGREQLIDLNVRSVVCLTLMVLLAFGVYYWSMPVLDLRILIGGRFEQPVLKYLLGIILTCYLSVGLSWLSLIYGKRFLNKQSSFMSLVSDSAYWVYLVHLPLAVFLQTLLVPLEWSVWLKLGVATMGTLVPCLLSYVIFVRYTPLGWLLHGKRNFP